MARRVVGLLRSEMLPENLIEKVSTEMKRDIYQEISYELDSKYKVEKYVMEKFKFVLPECIKIENETIGYYIPIISTLKNIFSDPTFNITREKSDDGVIRFHRDTILYNSSLFLKENETALSLNLYSDVVSLSNPLGYAKSKHNILQFYFTIVEMRSWERSKIQNIFNIAFIDYKKAKDHLHIVHSKIVAEMAKLEEGVELNGSVTKFALLNYFGDNLESHYIAGLQTHFHSGYVCRLCTIQHNQLGDVDVEHPFRTIEDYDKAITRLEQIRTVDLNTGVQHNIEMVDLNEQDSEDEDENVEEDNMSDQGENDDRDSGEDSDHGEDQDREEACDDLTETEILKGWKRKSPYNDLKSFSSLNSLPMDLLHDLHEGLLSYDVPCILQYFLKNKWFTLEMLNKRLKQFPYHRNMDKPALFLTKNFTRLPGKGMASGLLVQILPYLIMPYVPLDKQDDTMFKMLQYLHRILELTMSESFDVLLISEVDTCINSYFSSRKKESANFCSMKPKHHHILHLAESISYHGPPTLTWTARHEQKHTESTNLQRCSKNFKNVCWSLAKKSGLRLAVRMYSGVCAKSPISEQGTNFLFEIKGFFIYFIQGCIKFTFPPPPRVHFSFFEVDLSLFEIDLMPFEVSC